MEIFENDETGYLKWVQSNPAGWVANADKAANLNAYPMLHKATHKIISSDKRTNYTTHEWMKACALDLAELEAWAVARHGKSLERCGTCFPVESGSAGTKDSDSWSNAELAAAVEAYVDLARLVQSGSSTNKRAIYRELSARFGRTEKAFEYRFQNISYVLALMGRGWIPGLPPAKNVGSAIAGKIQQLIEDLDGFLSPESASEAIALAKARKALKGEPSGTVAPTATTKSVTTYVRNIEVKAWVLENSAGRCECCDMLAPFESVDGPFLEVHHVRRLCDKGSDTVCNAVAICPNCHRALHYAIDAEARIEALYVKLPRLKRVPLA